jgi:GxxExxY protein
MELMDEELEPDPALREVTNQIIGAAIAVHKELGAGYPEAIYQRAMAMEFEARGIEFEEEWVFQVTYRGRHVGNGRIDFLVARKVIVELKAVDQLAGIHTSQVITYLKATKLRLGILINFNVSLLKDGVRRIAR